MIFFLVVFIIATGVLTVCYIDLNDSYNYADNRADKYEELYEDVKENLRDAQSKYSDLERRVTDRMPIIITSIEIANIYKEGDIETEFGSTIYSSNTMYLKPRIQYYGLKDGSITLKTKWYKPDGFIRRGDSSPEGFSYSNSFSVSTKDHSLLMNGWGNDNKGNWGSGEYRLEIWYNDVCLKSKTFTIY